MPLTQTAPKELYTYDHIDHMLYRYDIFVGDVAEITSWWDELEDEGRVTYLSLAMSDWSNRHELGELFTMKQLSTEHTQRLAGLDQMLLAEALPTRTAYIPNVSALIQQLKTWGTPLTEAELNAYAVRNGAYAESSDNGLRH